MLKTAGTRRTIRWPFLLALIMAVLSVGYVAQANAAPKLCEFYDTLGDIYWAECDSGGDGGGGGGDGGGPSCDLSPGGWGEPTYTYCNGLNACADEDRDPSWLDAPGHEDIKQELGPRPSPNHVLVNTTCRRPDGSIFSRLRWDNRPSTAPNIVEQARRAYGRLAVPDFTVEFDPANMSYVGTDTHFWVEGPSSGRIVGTPTFTLVAVGVPSHIEIKPGDGSPSFECPWALNETDECLKNYENSSAGSRTQDDTGKPSHEVEVTIVYNVHFERRGGSAPVNLPGLEPRYLTIEGSETIPVPIGEIQALVTQ